MEQDAFKILVTRYLSKEATESEKEKVDELVTSDVDYARIFNDHQKLWNTTSQMNYSFDSETAKQWVELKQKIQTRDHEHFEKKESSGRAFFFNNNFLKAAASIALLIVSLVFLFQFLDYHEYDNVAYSTNDKKEVILPDGTTVLMNKNSTIMYPDKFEKTRTIYFSGEGFFKVIKYSEKPFIIESDQSKTRVLGTSFNLLTRSEQNINEIVVVTGKVAFSNIDNSKELVVLTQGEKGTLNKKSLLASKTDNKDNNFLSWKTGKIVFNDTNLGQAILDLEKYYDIEFVIPNNKLLNCDLTASFDNTPLIEVVKTLSISLDAKYELNKGEVLLNGNGCN